MINSKGKEPINSFLCYGNTVERRCAAELIHNVDMYILTYIQANSFTESPGFYCSRALYHAHYVAQPYLWFLSSCCPLFVLAVGREALLKSAQVIAYIADIFRLALGFTFRSKHTGHRCA